MIDDQGTLTTPLMTSHELGIDLIHLRALVRRKLCKYTAKTPTGGYLWNAVDAAAALRAAEFDRLRRAASDQLTRQKLELDWYAANLKAEAAAESHLWESGEDVQPAPTYTTGVVEC